MWGVTSKAQVVVVPAHGFDGMVNPCVGRDEYLVDGVVKPAGFRRDGESLCGA